MAMAREHGAKLIYDANELGFAEHEDNKHWQLLAAKHVRAVEETVVRRADAMTTIGQMIAEEYAREYGLKRIPVVVRNIIDTPPQPYRAPGTPSPSSMSGSPCRCATWKPSSTAPPTGNRAASCSCT